MSVRIPLFSCSGWSGTCYELHELKIWWLTSSSRAASDHDVMLMGNFAGIKREAVGELDPPTYGGKKAKS
ncbi:hypothetical protein F2Q68_00021447 [Brassica cretica]|uniref:Uncharacterized protein n=1 Tax=Brassica cretica TaxID=69181 RepID=A0A8S9FP52_BRACR|nr:hypothetical protein F2Q68_00021447 [Brassica cretica]